MTLTTLTYVVALMVALAILDVLSTAYMLTKHPGRYVEGNGPMARAMHAVGILPALLLLRLPFAVPAVLFVFPQQLAPFVPTAVLVAVANTPDWAFLAGLVLYGYVAFHNLSFVAKELVRETP